MLSNNTNSEDWAPLKPFDWNEVDPNIIGTGSIDTTCTIWDVTNQTARTQLIAHDRKVCKLAFAQGKDIFTSVGANGSVFMFDFQRLDHSTIIYESHKTIPPPSTRMEQTRSQLSRYLYCLSRPTVILDIRAPTTPVPDLGVQTGCVNATTWAPYSF